MSDRIRIASARLFASASLPLAYALVAIACIFSPPAHAGATWTVNNTGDHASGLAANCAPANATTCTLRDAVAAAAASGDTIVFDVGSNKTITLVSGFPLGKDLTIDGAASPGLAVSGNNATTVFSFNSGTTSISNLAIVNGNSNVIFPLIDGSLHVGGGIFSAGATLTLYRVVFSNNFADYGGAVGAYGGNITLIESTIVGNSATTRYGGGVFLELSTAMIARSLLNSNTAALAGSAIFADTATLALNNSTLTANTSAINNDGAFTLFGGTSTITNSTIVSNTGGGAYVASNNATFANTLVESCVYSGATVTDAGGNLDSGTTCFGSTPSNPTTRSNATFALGALQGNGGPTPTLLPAPNSDAIGAGIDETCAAASIGGVDQRGNPRPQGLHCDSGAVEASRAICYVRADASGAKDGSSWTNAYTDLQLALANNACDEVWVARGTYKPTSLSDHPEISFNIRPGLVVAGGYAGSAALREPGLYRTILSGDIDANDGGSGGIDTSWNQIAGTNSYHVVVIDGTQAAGPAGPRTVLDGFTITGGEAENYVGTQWLGGGLFCDGNGSGHACSPRLENLLFSGNLGGDGGGLTNYGDGGESSPRIFNVTFTGNRSDDGPGLLAGGGGMLDSARNNGTSSPILFNVTFTGNSALGCGGAIHNDNYYASGISSPSLTSVTLTGNSAFGGGAMCNATSGGTIAPTLTNVIVWGNSSNLGQIDDPIAAATPTLNYVITQDGCPAYATCTNLIGSDPLLGPLQDNGGYTPTMMPGDASPAIDAGWDSACAVAPDHADQRGAPRTQGAHCDIGAVEATNLVLLLQRQGVDPYVTYGTTVYYTVSLQNNSATQTVSGIRLSADASAAFDIADAGWQCFDVSCTNTLQPGLLDDVVTTLPPQTTVTWELIMPVFANASDGYATVSVHAAAAAAAVNTAPLVIFRGTFEPVFVP